MTDYDPPMESWIPPPFEPAAPKELEFGQFQIAKFVKNWLKGWDFVIARGRQWHILTQKNGRSVAALCGTMGILLDAIVITDRLLEIGDYKSHTCIDCLHMLRTEQRAPHRLFDGPYFMTFDDRKI
jgi:hypothetical protein